MNGTPAALAQSRELWRAKHMFCTDETPPGSITEARYVIDVHAAHGPNCLQYWAAIAYCDSSGDGDDI